MYSRRLFLLFYRAATCHKSFPACIIFQKTQWNYAMERNAGRYESMVQKRKKKICLIYGGSCFFMCRYYLYRGRRYNRSVEIPASADVVSLLRRNVHAGDSLCRKPGEAGGFRMAQRKGSCLDASHRLCRGPYSI